MVDACYLFFFHRSAVQVVSDTLNFKNVRLQEDGVYQCVAENILGMIVSSTWVNVRGNYLINC